MQSRVSSRRLLAGLASLGCACHLVAPFSVALEPRPDAGAPNVDARGAADLRDAKQTDALPTWPWPDTPTFGEPVALARLNAPAGVQKEPFLSADWLTLYFCSTRPGSEQNDLYFVTRPTTDDAFGEPHPYETLNSTSNEWRLVIAADNLTAYLTTDRPGGAGDADIWVATRSDPAVPFDNVSLRPLAELNTDNAEHDPFPSVDNLRLYYYSDDWYSADSGADLLVAERSTVDDPFGEPTPIAGVNQFPAREGNPVLSPDERLLLFNSSRGGDLDIWYARREARDQPFSEAKVVLGVNSSHNEANLHLREDGCVLYFARSGNLYWSQLQTTACASSPAGF